MSLPPAIRRFVLVQRPIRHRVLHTGPPMKLSTRLTIAMIALVMLTVAAISALTYRNVLALTQSGGLDRTDSDALAAAQAVLGPSLAGGLVAVICALMLAVALASSLTRPLVQMTHAMEGLARDEAVAVPRGGGAEIQGLADAFTRMAEESRHKTAALMQEVEERRRIFDTSPDVIFVTDRTGTFTRVSPASEPVLGYRPEEMIGQSAKSFVFPDDLERTRGEMRAARRGHVMRNFESRYVGKDGRVVLLAWSGVWSEPTQQYFFVGRDMTEKIAAEEQLRHAHKMEAVGQLTGGIAHDFNNMLTVITGTIDILAEAVADKPELYNITKLISEAADRGAELTSQLLAFARKQPLQPHKVDINELIADAGKMLRPTLGEHIEIRVKLEREIWPAVVDPTQLTSALLNLAVNARDAMPDGGNLMLETGNVILDESYVETLKDVPAGNYVMIAVTDTGTGIPADIRDKIFEPFYSTKDVGKGTGLGLSMVYGFVKQSGGHILVYSEIGFGTTFKVYLPRADEHAHSGTGSMADAVMEGGNETILAVEDDPLVRTYVTTQLESLGYTTLSAKNAKEALELIDGGAEFDLLFTDVIMPGGMNGRELADAAAERKRSLKVLFTSGYAEDGIIHHGRLDPGVLLLPKPYRKADLARMLRLALAGAAHSPAGQPAPRARAS
jgi:PAS domain S-box-containing protein